MPLPEDPQAEDQSALLPVARPQGAPVPGDDLIASLAPFGIGEDKPHHFLEMAEVVWENRDNLPYAWKILTRGVCDGCSLGPRGLRDDVIEGVHLCTSRLKLLRMNTMGALAPADLIDMDRLRGMTNAQLQALGRLPYPFIYRKGDRGFSRLSWDDALRIIGDKIAATDPDRLGFFASSKGLTNESYYTITKAARLLGTNNVDLCARLCHAATVSGLKGTIGVGAPTCSLSDLIGTDLLLLIGTNISNNQPVTMKYLVEAKKKGTRVVVVNTTREKGLEAYWVPSAAKSAVFGTRLMDDFVQINAGGDIAFLNGVLKAVIERGAIDRDYVATHTTGWAELATALQGQSWETLEQISGASRQQMSWVGELYSRARSCVTVYSMGLTQHRFGVENVEAVVNLHLSRGMIGRDKCGIMPIRGHSGVQGGGECGVSPTSFPGGRKVNADTAAEMSQLWGGHPVPHGPGLSTGPQVLAAMEGRLDVHYNVGGNLLMTMPDPAFVRDAFGKVGLRVHQDVVVNTSHLIEPEEMVILLPAQTRYEQKGGGTSTSTERRIRFSPEIPGHRIGEAKPEWWIPCQVAIAAKPQLRDQLDYQDSQEIRDEMERTMPVYQGIASLRKAGDWVQWGGRHLCSDGFPNMPDGKARFTALEPPDIRPPAGRFLLTTRRGKQFNSIIIKEIDHLQGGRDRNDLFMNAADISAQGLHADQQVIVRSEHGEWKAVVRPMNIQPGVVQAYWPECNPVIALRWDPRSEEPDYNAVVEVLPA